MHDFDIFDEFGLSLVHETTEIMVGNGHDTSSCLERGICLIIIKVSDKGLVYIAFADDESDNWFALLGRQNVKTVKICPCVLKCFLFGRKKVAYGTDSVNQSYPIILGRNVPAIGTDSLVRVADGWFVP